MQGIFCTAVDTKPSNKSHINCLYEQLIATAVTLANRKKNTIQKNLFALWGVCVYPRVCMCVWLSVAVVSARRGNLLYKRRADVSYVYPCSHGTKEPCIPNHSNPGPRLSWFSDINNFLFHFPWVFFSLLHSSCLAGNREALCEQILIFDQRYHNTWDSVTGHERLFPVLHHHKSLGCQGHIWFHSRKLV